MFSKIVRYFKWHIWTIQYALFELLCFIYAPKPNDLQIYFLPSFSCQTKTKHLTRRLQRRNAEIECLGIFLVTQDDNCPYENCPYDNCLESQFCRKCVNNDYKLIKGLCSKNGKERRVPYNQAQTSGLTGWIFNMSKGAFPPSHFRNKLADKLTYKVASVSSSQDN
jgi:hypothetical protein